MAVYKGYRVETTRLRDWDYRERGWYFITICTSHHACALGRASGLHIDLSPIGLTALSELERMPDHYSNVTLDCSIVMPNHLHAIVVIEGLHAYSPSGGFFPRPRALNFPQCAPQAGSLASMVRAYKAGVTRWCRANGYDWFAWQPGFYDRILRSNASVNSIRNYIRRNPANWLLDRDHPRNCTTVLQET